MAHRRKVKDTKKAKDANKPLAYGEATHTLNVEQLRKYYALKNLHDDLAPYYKEKSE